VAKQPEEFVTGVWTKKQTEITKAKVFAAVYYSGKVIVEDAIFKI
jgi:hypothetical protein